MQLVWETLWVRDRSLNILIVWMRELYFGTALKFSFHALLEFEFPSTIFIPSILSLNRVRPFFKHTRTWSILQWWRGFWGHFRSIWCSEPSKILTLHSPDVFYVEWRCGALMFCLIFAAVVLRNILGGEHDWIGLMGPHLGKAWEQYSNCPDYRYWFKTKRSFHIIYGVTLLGSSAD